MQSNTPFVSECVGVLTKIQQVHSALADIPCYCLPDEAKQELVKANDALLCAMDYCFSLGSEAIKEERKLYSGSVTNVNKITDIVTNAIMDQIESHQ